MNHFPAVKNYIESLNLATYCIVAAFVALAGSVALIFAAFFAARALGLGAALETPIDTPNIVDGFGSIVFAPVVETFLLAGCLKIFSGLGRTGSCAASAIAWGIAHAFLAPIRFFGTVWSFFIFGLSYLLWRKHSFKRAFVAAAVPHAIVNTAVLAVWASGA